MTYQRSPRRSEERPSCNADADHGPWFRGEGFWNALGLGFFFPLISLAIYVAALLPAVLWAGGSWWIRGPVALLPLLVLVVVLAVQRQEGHRGWCLLGRSVLIACVIPGLLLVGMFS